MGEIDLAQTSCGARQHGKLMPPCTGEPLCRCVSDTFAILRGRAIKAFLHDPVADFCEMSMGSHLLGESAIRAQVLQRDVRFVSAYALPLLFRPNLHCNMTRTAYGELPRRPFQLTMRSLLAIPPGPWDGRRNAFCRAARAGTEHNLCIEPSPFDNDKA